MTTFDDLRAEVEHTLTADPDEHVAVRRAFVKQVLARLDAAERALEEARAFRDEGEDCDAYDALVREQDGGEP